MRQKIFFAENKLPDACSQEEIDENVSEIKDLRKNYKRVHRGLKEIATDYNAEFKPKYDKVCQRMSDYIIEAKVEKKTRSDNLEEQRIIDKEKEMETRRLQEEAILKEKVEQEERICDIKIKEINEKIAQIKGMYSSMTSLEDDEVLDLKSNLNNIDRELRDLRDMRDKFESLISLFIHKEKIMKDLAKSYKEVNEAAVKHKEELKTEIKNRD